MFVSWTGSKIPCYIMPWPRRINLALGAGFKARLKAAQGRPADHRSLFALPGFAVESVATAGFYGKFASGPGFGVPEDYLF